MASVSVGGTDVANILPIIKRKIPSIFLNKKQMKYKTSELVVCVLPHFALVDMLLDAFMWDSLSTS